MGQEHSNAFTVAKMMDADLLKTVQVKLQQALENGESFGSFSKGLIPQLQAAGWWGKKDIVDPLTGLVTKAQLGSASRLETIFRSNIQSAYSVGQWDNIQQAKRTAPYLMYDAVDDGRTRPEHAARDGEVHEVDSVFWQSHFPPNGWNCRCGVIQLDKDDLEDMGLTPQPKKPNITTQKWTNPRNGVVQDIPIDTDPGWNVNPGIHRQKQLAEAADSKAQAMLNAQQEVALKKALDKQKLEQIAYEKQIAQDKQLKALMKQQSEASDQISEALTANTPYLANEIKKLQKANPTKDSMSILQAATAKALKSEQNSMVQTWKQSKKKGKKPSAKSDAYVKTLPEEVQASLNAEINAVNKATQEVAELEAKLAAVEAAQAEALAIQKAAEAAAFEAEIAAKVAANKAAVQELEKISQGKADVQPGLKKKILDKITSTETGSQYSIQELLDEVVEQAGLAQGKAEQSSVLSGYKKKVLEGKIPTAKQILVFNKLDDATKAKVLADIDKKKGANAATVSDPSAIGTTQTAQAVSDQSPTGTTATLAKVELDGYDDLNDLDKYNILYSGYKATGSNEIPVSPFSIAKMDRDKIADILSTAEIEVLMNPDYDLPDIAKLGIVKLNKQKHKWTTKPKAVEAPSTPSKKKKPKAPKKTTTSATPNAGQAPDADSLVQIGPQGGSNKGGLYQDPETGQKWYLKQPDSEDYARNEVLAGKFYEAAGIEVPELHNVTWGGKPSIASKIIDDLGEDQTLLTGKKDVPGVADGFVMDAWLGNWDVVGTGFDNLLVKAGRAIRVDTGGAMRYRAQGGLKGKDWGNKVLELESLTDGSFSQTTSVFGKLTQAQKIESARKVVNFTDDQIDDLVAAYGPKKAADAKKLAATLKARRDNIAKQFPEAKQQASTTPLDTKRVTRIEQENINNSRSNGYAIATDKDQIEDQSVLVSKKLDKKGNESTHGTLKLRPDAAKKLGKQLPKGADAVEDFSDLGELVKAAIISIKSRVDKGVTTIEGSALTKVEKARDRFFAIETIMERQVKDGLRPQKQLDDFRKKLLPIIDNFTDTVVDQKPTWSKANKAIFDPADINIPAAKGANKGSKWTKIKDSYETSVFNNGFATTTGKQYNLSSVSVKSDVYELEMADGIKVRFHPDKKDTVQTLKGRIEIEVPGGGEASAAQIFKVLDELGVDGARATDLDRELLYLQQIAYANNLDTRPDVLKAMKTKDPGQVKQAIDFLLDDSSGYVSLDDNPFYKPFGERQAFGHGREIKYRPELLGSPKWAEFSENFRLHHDFTNGDMVDSLRDIIGSGGHMAPTADKMRRGIPLGGMSPGRDLKTGGANYFFTRINKKERAHKKQGIVWKTRVAARVDAITYDSDLFGDTRGNHVRENRRTTIKQMKMAVNDTSNETILKDSLSIFDDVDRIVCDDSAEVRAVIKLFTDAGLEEWPDGRALTEVIRARPGR